MPTPPFHPIRWFLLCALLLSAVQVRADVPVEPSISAVNEAAKLDAGSVSDVAVADLVKRGRAQYLAGEPGMAAQTFTRALEFDPQNTDARAFLERIAAASVDHDLNRTRTSAQMLADVQRAWLRPTTAPGKTADVVNGAGRSPLQEKLDAIVLPDVGFSGMELSRVVHALGAMSEEYDRSESGVKGLNIVLVDPTNADPAISLSLRNVSLKRLLDFVTSSVGYQYEVQADAVVVRPGGGRSSLETEFFPVSRSTVLRLTGRGTPGAAAAGASPTGRAGPPPLSEDEGRVIRGFLQLAGVNFDDEKGSTLAFDGSQLIVTQTPHNLERVRNILGRYSDVRQVEIEAKFMEVQDGALEELGVNWNVATKPTQRGAGVQAAYRSGNRSLADAFSSSNSGVQGSIVRPVVDATDSTPAQDGINLPIINPPPPIPGTNNVGLGANPLATVTGVIGEFNVNAVIRALSQKTGTELLSAPKLTVLSGNPATITVAQELRYPQSYGQVQSQVGTGNASGGGSAGVAITAGTPQEFTTRNVGVELKVTPTVEEDNHSISLDLNPKVTEFEGFVEYGGQSIAISGSTTVTVPSGFYQPIFGVREVSTKVTIWDGATIVMGGLTRENVKKNRDKVPVLGNVPVLGRLFRSSGESAQKRNLLIFVTANLVNPGGGLKKQVATGASPDSLYQNPVIVPPPPPSPR